MAEVKVKARRMSNADAQFVSLVTRGANRTPIRLMKREAEGEAQGDATMFDLSKVFKSEPKPSAIVAVLVKADADRPAAEKALKDAGFRVDLVTESDDGLVYSQVAKADPKAKVVVVKMSEDVAVAVANVTKYIDTYGYNTVDFKQLVAQGGLWPSLRMASEALETVISNVTTVARTPDEAATLAGNAIDDYKAMVVALFSAVPMMAFKLDGLSLDGPALDPAGAAEQPADAGAGATEGDTVVQETVSKTDDKGAETEGTAVEAAKPEEPKPETAEVAKTEEQAAPKPDDTKAEAEPAPVAEVAKADDLVGQMKALFTDMQATVEKSVGELRTTLEGFGERLTTVETVAKTAKEAVEGTVIGEQPDDTRRKTTRKSEGSNDGFEHIDTAYGLPKD